MDTAIIIAVLVAAIFVSFVAFIALNKKNFKKAFEAAQADSERILEEAHREKERIVQEAHNEVKQEAKTRRLQFEQEAKKRRSELAKLEGKVKGREELLEKKLSQLEKKEQDLEKMTGHLNQEEERLKQLIRESEKVVEDSRKTLETIANLSQEEARRELISSLEVEAKNQARESLKKIEEDTKLEGERIARSMVSLAVQRVSSEYVNDSTVTVVGLPSDEMKGRIIGREGRNIRAIEQATGVDLIIDDTPEAVIISCFNPIRREIANISLQRLIADGRIHPARIEETVKKVTEEFDQIIQENGEQAAFDTGITDLHPELLRYLGKLKYRTAGAQTVLQHAVEVAHICGIMAGEMGLNVKKAKRVGLLHDIGKAVDQETEGHHSKIGADLCVKYNEPTEVVDAVLNHHNEDLNYAYPLTVVVQAANVLSERRPGARREVLETYIKRLQDMESLVNSIRGIQESYVIQAGREVRALVTPTGVSDSEVIDIANEIALRLRKEMTFPGQVKVIVLRESKYAEFAK
ncbi:MAG TPA: ribonuclease Y [Oligoflexus sp.]|uniref:ribonuclease Y n=1 Tax=Oligoflexus sp. TaxID=1971216 RepID=UPI002D5C14CD|nr:ribonuclease Y [Oligoflexus sp.]HYX36797.1 ribonuclease Y [Oligoflexus sp.]